MSYLNWSKFSLSEQIMIFTILVKSDSLVQALNNISANSKIITWAKISLKKIHNGENISNIFDKYFDYQFVKILYSDVSQRHIMICMKNCLQLAKDRYESRLRIMIMLFTMIPIYSIILSISYLLQKNIFSQYHYEYSIFMKNLPFWSNIAYIILNIIIHPISIMIIISAMIFYPIIINRYFLQREILFFSTLNNILQYNINSQEAIEMSAMILNYKIKFKYSILYSLKQISFIIPYIYKINIQNIDLFKESIQNTLMEIKIKSQLNKYILDSLMQFIIYLSIISYIVILILGMIQILL